MEVIPLVLPTPSFCGQNEPTDTFSSANDPFNPKTPERKQWLAKNQATSRLTFDGVEFLVTTSLLSVDC